MTADTISLVTRVLTIAIRVNSVLWPRITRLSHKAHLVRDLTKSRATCADTNSDHPCPKRTQWSRRGGPPEGYFHLKKVLSSHHLPLKVFGRPTSLSSLHLHHTSPQWKHTTALCGHPQTLSSSSRLADLAFSLASSAGYQKRNANPSDQAQSSFGTRGKPA